MTDCRAEFPEDWLTNAQLSRSGRDAALNFFSVHAARSLAYWQDKGWIHSDDPRGRFQWYCRYYMGRRSLDDERQIRRRQAMTRHIAQIQEELRTRRS